MSKPTTELSLAFAPSSSTPTYWPPFSVACTIAVGEIVILRVAPRGVRSFNETLRQMIDEFRPGVVHFGIADTSDLKPKDADHAHAVRRWRAQIGWDDRVEAPLGYYCFRRGILVAYHPGLADDDPNTQFAAGVVSLADLVGTLFTKGAARAAWIDTAYTVLEAGPGKTIAEFFKAALSSVEATEATKKAAEEAEATKRKAKEEEATRKAKEEEAKRRAAQAKVDTTQLAAAYRLLGIASSASDDEFKRAYHGSAAKAHPDMGPESEWEERTLLMQQINAAYALIKDHRKANGNVAVGPPGSHRAPSRRSEP